jgi:hypothetical protein
MASQINSDKNSVDRRSQGPADHKSKEVASSTPTSSNDGVSIPSNTYDKYIDLTRRVLQKSIQSLDTQNLIRQAYGDEKMTVFGGSDMLQGILDGLLDKMSKETVLQDFEEYCDSTSSRSHETSGLSPKQYLHRIDNVIRFVVEWEDRRNRWEAKDAESAQQSLDVTLLPEGVTTDDVLHYRKYQQQLQAREALLHEILRVEQQVSTLQDEQDQTRAGIQEQLKRVQMVERQVEDAANACSMVAN